MTHSFYSIYHHGFVRVAVGVPAVRVANPVYNGERTLALAQRAADQGAAVALFPELGISAYTNDDLFHQETLLEATVEALSQLVEASKALTPILLVGAPLSFEGKLFNCAVVIYRGAVLGIVPKSYQPNYR
jgi:NAD+ synthase (glutamine-hydrolysing)